MSEINACESCGGYRTSEKVPGLPSCTCRIHKLFVYGSLMSGMFYNHLLAGCEMVGIARAKSFLMLDLGHYPGVIPQEGRGDDFDEDDIVGELWEVGDETLARLDEFEGVPDLYTRETAEVYDENRIYRDVYIYVYRLNVIPSGDWRAHLTEEQDVEDEWDGDWLENREESEPERDSLHPEGL